MRRAALLLSQKPHKTFQRLQRQAGRQRGAPDTAAPAATPSTPAAAPAAPQPTTSAPRAPGATPAPKSQGLSPGERQDREATARYRRMDTEALHEELTALNKPALLRARAGAVLPILRVVKDRIHLVEHQLARDAVLVAAAAGHSQLAVDLYMARNEEHSGDVQWMLLDSVVDAAAATGNITEIVRVAQAGARHSAQNHDDIPSDMAAARALWRVFCTWHRSSRGARRSGKPPPELHDVLNAARAIWAALGTYNSAIEAASFDVVARATRRAVLYAERDEGEALFYQLALRHRLFRCVPDAVASDVAAGAAGMQRRAATVAGAEAADVTPLPLQLVVALLRSCKRGHWTEMAQQYFDYHAAAGAAGATPHESQRKAGAVAGRGVEEVAVFSLLAVYQAAKDHKSIAKLGRSMLEAGVSPNLAGIIAQSAGEALATDVATAAFDILTAPGVEGGDRGAQRPSQFAVFASLLALAKCGAPDFAARAEACFDRGLIADTAEARVFLVLQAALHSPDPAAAAAPALALLQEPTDGLEAGNSSRGHGSPLHALLQGTGAPPRGRGALLTERVCNQVLQLYLRVDSDAMLRFYRRAVEGARQFRAPWPELLVTWADRRRYLLTAAQQTEVLQLLGKDMGGDLFADTDDSLAKDATFTGVRPMVGLLKHDMRNAQFPGAGGSARAPPPPMLDPRAYFARRSGRLRTTTASAPPATPTVVPPQGVAPLTGRFALPPHGQDPPLLTAFTHRALGAMQAGGTDQVLELAGLPPLPAPVVAAEPAEGSRGEPADSTPGHGAEARV